MAMQKPAHGGYDVVIVGGAMMGSSVAWWLTRNPEFKGRVLVVERDPTYEFASTTHTNSCIRQQFSNEINIRIGLFGARFIRNFQDFMEDAEAPEIVLQNYGYLYLAQSAEFAETLRQNQAIQAECGAGTRVLTPEEMAAAWPFLNLDGIVLGSHNPVDEGYFDGGTIFDQWRRKARANGAEYIRNEVAAMTRDGARVTEVTLADGTRVAAGVVVNCSGPRAAVTARMAGLDIPVEARRRYTYIFDAAEPLDRDLPLTIDPSGVHMRSDGRYYLCGCPPFEDRAMEFDDFSEEPGIWEEKLWPALAHRIPAFERIKVVNSWVGHYAYNTLDQNAVIGFHPEVANFLFVNGFSGHGLQQSPAMGRGAAELILYGEYRSLDMSALGYERIAANAPFLEKAVI